VPKSRDLLRSSGFTSFAGRADVEEVMGLCRNIRKSYGDISSVTKAT